WKRRNGASSLLPSRTKSLDFSNPSKPPGKRITPWPSEGDGAAFCLRALSLRFSCLVGSAIVMVFIVKFSVVNEVQHRVCQTANKGAKKAKSSKTGQFPERRAAKDEIFCPRSGAIRQS